MNIQELKQLIYKGEKVDIECKEAESNVPRSAYESYSVFANTKGGILNRQIRSIQTEGHFGDIKENEKFRRFNYRSAEKVYKEFMLYAIGRNINSAC